MLAGCRRRMNARAQVVVERVRQEVVTRASGAAREAPVASRLSVAVRCYLHCGATVNVRSAVAMLVCDRLLRGWDAHVEHKSSRPMRPAHPQRRQTSSSMRTPSSDSTLAHVELLSALRLSTATVEHGKESLVFCHIRWILTAARCRCTWYARGAPRLSRPPDHEPSVGVERGVSCLYTDCAGVFSCASKARRCSSKARSAGGVSLPERARSCSSTSEGGNESLEPSSSLPSTALPPPTRKTAGSDDGEEESAIMSSSVRC